MSRIKHPSVRDEEQDKSLVLPIEGDLEGSPLAPALGARARRELERPAGKDPALDIVEASQPAKAVEFLQLFRRRSQSCGASRCSGFRRAR